RLEFESDLGLLAGLRQQQLAGILANDRIVAGRIGDVGRKAEIEIVDQPGASAELAVFAALSRADMVVVGSRDPVVAAAQHEREAVELDLILRIKAELLLRQSSVGEYVAAEGGVVAVNRIQQIE